MKRKLNLFMAVTLAITSTTAVSAAEFTDTSNYWAKEEIAQWADYGVVNGYNDGSFKPSNNITRAEMSTLLDNVMQYVESGENNFSDLNGNEWYADSILKNVGAENINGYTDGTVGATKNITRQEVAVMICKAFDITPINGATSFADDTQIADWAKPSVNALAQGGYINGREGNLYAPTDEITRAEVVKMLDNLIADLYNTAGTFSDVQTGNVLVNTEDVELKDTVIEGNLFIAAGVGEGDFTLDNVQVEGEVIVEGGGTNSVKFINGSTAKEVKMQKNSKNDVRLFVDEKSSVERIDTAGKAGVKLEGQGHFGTVVANGNNRIEVAPNTKLDKVEINGNSQLTNNGHITEIIINASAGEIIINGTGIADLLTANNTSVVIDLEIIKVVVNNDQIKIVTTDKVKEVVDKNGKDISDKVEVVDNIDDYLDDKDDEDTEDTDNGSNGGSNGGDSDDDSDDDSDETTDPVETNTAPVINAKFVTTNYTSDGSIKWDLNDLFTDKEGDELTIKLVSVVVDGQFDVIKEFTIENNVLTDLYENIDGEYVIKVKANDGNLESKVATLTLSGAVDSGTDITDPTEPPVEGDTIPPVITSCSAIRGTTTDSAIISFYSNENGDNFNYEITRVSTTGSAIVVDSKESAGGVCEGKNDFTVDNILANTEYTVNLKVSDYYNNVAEYTFKFTL